MPESELVVVMAVVMVAILARAAKGKNPGLVLRCVPVSRAVSYL